jgi:anti-anti-sigma factor
MGRNFAVSREPVTDEIECIAIRGELDIANAEQVRRHISETMAGEAHGIVVDMHDVSFVDTTGLAVLVQAAREAKDSGRHMFIAGCGPQVRQVFGLTGVTVYVDMAADREAAVARLRAPLPA